MSSCLSRCMRCAKKKKKSTQQNQKQFFCAQILTVVKVPCRVILRLTSISRYTTELCATNSSEIGKKKFVYFFKKFFTTFACSASQKMFAKMHSLGNFVMSQRELTPHRFLFLRSTGRNPLPGVHMRELLAQKGDYSIK